MSRVFETLTAAVNEKQNPAKPEVSGTESQGALIVRFPPARRAGRASNEIPSSLNRPTMEETPQSSHSKIHPDQRIRGADKRERDSEDRRHLARKLALLATMSVIGVCLAARLSDSRASQQREHNR